VFLETSNVMAWVLTERAERLFDPEYSSPDNVIATGPAPVGGALSYSAKRVHCAVLSL
jgi:hypothetical protein